MDSYFDPIKWAAEWPAREVAKYMKLELYGIVTRKERLAKVAELRAKYGIEMYDKELDRKRRKEAEEESARSRRELKQWSAIREEERQRFKRMSRWRRFFYKGD